MSVIKRKIVYSRCPSIDELMPALVASLGLPHVDPSRVRTVYSKGTHTRALARIYGLPKPLQVGHSLPPLYTIELVCENLLRTTCDDVAQVLTHELLHIPTTFSGALRPHGQQVNHRIVNRLARRIPSILVERLCTAVEKCCREGGNPRNPAVDGGNF